jgi:hypothetical protein
LVFKIRFHPASSVVKVGKSKPIVPNQAIERLAKALKSKWGGGMPRCGVPARRAERTRKDVPLLAFGSLA